MLSTNDTNIFDPRVNTEDVESSKKAIIWSSQSEKWARDSVFNGKPISKSPYYEGDPYKRRGNLIYQYTDNEIKEIVKCSASFKYFLSKYCKIKLDDGTISNFKLRKYQKRQIKQLINNKYCIFLWSRQSGKTIGVSLYMLWRALFNPDFNIAILANKGGTSEEVMKKLKSIYFELPFFLKGGVVGWNNTTMVFDNGSRIYTGVTTLDALNGKTANLLYMDEYAFVGKGGNKIEFQKEFLANALPIISSQKNGQLIMSSTPNGKDYFYELCNSSMRGDNQFNISVVKWHEVPGRDEKWAKTQISAMGIDKFRIQYECSFDTTSESLLSMNTMKRLFKFKKPFNNDVYDEQIISEFEKYLYFDTDVDIDFENDFVMLSVDVAEGLRQDYSTIQILRMEIDQTTGDIFFRQIGVWSSNEVSIEDFASVISELFNNFNENYTKLLVEYNTYGDTLFVHISNNQEFEIPLESICKFKHNNENKRLLKGLRIDSQRKNIAVKSFKSMMDMGKLIIKEDKTIKEIENFQKNRKGRYEASIGHDDRVTPLTNFSYFIQLTDNQFTNWLDDFSEVNGYDIDVDFTKVSMRAKSLPEDASEKYEINENIYSGLSLKESTYYDSIVNGNRI